jgi:hypothetical protein
VPIPVDVFVERVREEISSRALNLRAGLPTRAGST